MLRFRLMVKRGPRGRNGTVIGALFVAALSMAGSIYLIAEMDQPFNGFIKISSAPMYFALEQLGK